MYSHINSFPCIESHYCRADTKRQYLDSSLTIRKMFELYKAESELNTAGEFYYRKVFNEEFNLCFHKPSKDACDTCDVFSKAKTAGTLTNEQQSNLEAHLKRKEQA